jgi:hypothetical protein
MASTSPNRPSGAKPSRYLSGADWNGQTNMYAFNASNSVAAYKYDLVSFDTTNRSLALTDNYMPALPNVMTVASDITTAIQRGVVVGFLVEPEFNMTVTASLGLMYRVASTKRYAQVVDDPFVVFTVQEEAQSYTSTTANAINKSAGTDYIAGSTTTGVSGMTLKSSDVQTAAVRPFRILRYTQTVDNFNWVAADNPSYAKFDVILSSNDLFGSAAMTNFGA